MSATHTKIFALHSHASVNDPHGNAVVHAGRIPDWVMAFLLWVNATIFTFLAISPISALLASLTGSPVWTVPKPLELKLYAAAILSAVVWIAVSARFLRSFLSRSFVLYRWALAVLLPFLVIANALPPVDMPQHMAMSVAALCALLIFALEAFFPHRRYSDAAERWSATVLACSILCAVVLIPALSVGNIFSPFSMGAITVFCITWFLLQWRMEGIPDVFWAILSFGIVFVTVFLMSTSNFDSHHFSYLLGPVVNNLHAGKHPLADIDAQYGGGLTIFLSIYFRIVWGFVTTQGLTVLMKVLTFGQYLLFYAIGVRLYHSRRIAFCTLIAILVFTYFSQGENYFLYPSTGVLRFGILYLMVGVAFCEAIPASTRLQLNGILAAIGTLWSFESFVYVVPAFLAAEWQSGNGVAALRSYMSALGVLLIAYVAVPWLSGVPIDLTRYYEYALFYSNGFGQIPLARATSFWMLFPLLYVFILAECQYGRIKDKQVVMLVIYGLAIFTYFGGRAHPNNLHHIAAPFILLAVYEATRLPERWRLSCLAAIFAVFLSAQYSHFRSGIILRDLWSINGANVDVWQTPGDTATLHAAADGNCNPNMHALLSYAQGSDIALISTRDDSYLILSCLGLGNVLGIDPLGETAISPVASNRAVQRMLALPQRYIVVLDEGTLGDGLAQRLLAAARAEEIQRFPVGGTTAVIFRNGTLKTFVQRVPDFPRTGGSRYFRQAFSGEVR